MDANRHEIDPFIRVYSWLKRIFAKKQESALLQCRYSRYGIASNPIISFQHAFQVTWIVWQVPSEMNEFDSDLLNRFGKLVRARKMNEPI
jgi:hypothetical protein